MSLRTESQSVAEKKVLPVILEWKKQIDLAKGLDIGSDDELLVSIMWVRLQDVVNVVMEIVGMQMTMGSLIRRARQLHRLNTCIF